jgi:MFS family permease
VLGPLLALTGMLWLAQDIEAVLWLAVVPAFVAVLLLGVALREPEPSTPGRSTGQRLTFADAKRLSRRYWLVVALGAVFTLARFSEAFLILRAQEVGLGMAYVPTIMVVMNLVYAACAYPAGAAADRFAARTLLVFGLGVLIIADILLAMATSWAIALLGAAFWGLHMAFTQGLLAKLVSDAAPARLRGTAFGVFNLVTGGALLLASVIAGSLWSALGAAATFMTGAGFAACAALGLLFYRRRSGAVGSGGGT